jgi:serine/threonine protein phosphatase PrpC
MNFEYKMIAATDIGQVRVINEDSIRIMPSIQLAVVADGMGGHKSGDIASRMAVNSLCDHFEEQAMFGMGKKNDATATAMTDAFSLANSLVYASAHQLENCDGMGTTLVAASFQSNIVHIGHIGDSRVYSFSRGQLQQLTVDHTLATELASSNSSWEIPAYSHHVLRKALGIESSCSPDIFTVAPKDNQIFLMCSDGLTGVVSDQDISTILTLRAHQPEYCLETMIDACLENGAPDNISIILIFANRK